MIDETNLKDIWRERNPTKKQYTFYSNRYSSYSRIDMIWASTELICNVQEVEIETSTWADHNPITIKWKGQTTKSRWTLNNTILKEKDFVQKMEKELAFFFKENRKEDTSMQNLWDKMKAFTRGLIIDYTRKRNLNLTTAARLLVAQYWKKEDVPIIEEWTLKVINLAEMAKVLADLKDYSQEKYILEWKRWIDYVQNKYKIKKFK